MSAAPHLWLGSGEDAGVLARLHAGALLDPWPEAAFFSLLSRSEVFVVVGARTDTHLPDGFILVRTVAGEAEVLTFCVAESARKRGLGRALLDAACGIAAGRESGEMFLEVSENNAAALSLYQKSGFVAVGRRAAYYRHGLQAADAIVMRKPLSDVSPDIVEGNALSFRSDAESTKRN